MIARQVKYRVGKNEHSETKLFFSEEEQELIKDRMSEIKISSYTVAEKIHCSNNSFCKMLKGTFRITEQQLSSLNELLELDIQLPDYTEVLPQYNVKEFYFNFDEKTQEIKVIVDGEEQDNYLAWWLEFTTLIHSDFLILLKNRFPNAAISFNINGIPYKDKKTGLYNMNGYGAKKNKDFFAEVVERKRRRKCN